VTQQGQQQQDSSQRPPRDLSPRLLRDWLLHPVLQADLQLALGRAVAVAPAVAEAALVLDLSQAPAALQPDLSQAPAALQPDSSAPGHPDSYLRLPVVLVPEVELVREKSTRT
jgi:hypothetical protein